MDTKKPENMHHLDVMSPYPSSMFENVPKIGILKAMNKS